MKYNREARPHLSSRTAPLRSEGLKQFGGPGSGRHPGGGSTEDKINAANAATKVAYEENRAGAHRAAADAHREAAKSITVGGGSKYDTSDLNHHMSMADTHDLVANQLRAHAIMK